MAYLLVAPYFTGIDANGAPLNGGKVYTYIAGTTTPQASYTDYTGITPAANPVILDSAGRAEIWLSGSYKIVVKDALDNTIHTTDNITATAATATELNYLAGVVAGTAQANKAVVLDSNSNVTGLATNTSNTSSTGIANMAAVQSSMIGGFVNKFRNGNFQIAGRTTSGSVTTGNSLYTLDGWILGATGNTATWQQQSLQAVYGNSFTIVGDTSMSATFIRQRIEGLISTHFINKQVTVQFLILNNTGASITPTLTVRRPTVLDNYTATVTDVNGVSLQPIAQLAYGLVAYTFTASASSNLGMEITVDFGAVLNSNTKAIAIHAADIRATPGVATGLNSNPPVVEFRPVHVENEFCKRYLPSFGTLAGPLGTGAATSTSASGYFIPFRVPTRIAPTGLTVTTPANLQIASFAGADVAALTGLTFSQASPEGALVTAAVAATPLTSATSYLLYAKTALAGNLIFTGAEL